MSRDQLVTTTYKGREQNIRVELYYEDLDIIFTGKVATGEFASFSIVTLADSNLTERLLYLIIVVDAIFSLSKYDKE